MAKDKSKKKKNKSKKKSPELKEKKATRQYTGVFGGEKVAYTATAATQVFEVNEKKASFFYVSVSFPLLSCLLVCDLFDETDSELTPPLELPFGFICELGFWSPCPEDEVRVGLHQFLNITIESRPIRCEYDGVVTFTFPFSCLLICFHAVFAVLLLLL